MLRCGAAIAMGGGGVIRTVAKTAVLGGYRSPLAEGIFRGPRSFPSTVPATTGAAVDGSGRVPLTASATAVGATVAQHHPVSVGHDDYWEFAGGVEEELYGTNYPPPRVVFGPVPTLEEAKEATSDLKEAIEKVYFSSETTALQESPVAQTDLKFQPDSFGNSSTMMSATGRSSCLSSGSRHVIQAFSLLKESSEAQNIVASLASDQNVWDAVLKNEKVVEFCRSHQTDLFSKGGSANSDAESVADNEVEKILDCFMEKTEENRSENGFMHFVNVVKQKVSELVSSLSELINSIFSSPAAKASAADGSSSWNQNETAAVAGGSFLALALAAILVILVKRA